MKKIIYLLSALIISSNISAKELMFESSDGRYKILLSDDNELRYEVNYFNHKIIESSRLGIAWNENWYEGIEMGNVSTYQCDSIWTPVYGERQQIKESYLGWEVELKKKGSRHKLILDIRIYNEGVAFRYKFPGGQYLKISDEYTQFVMPKGSMAWHTLRAQTRYNKQPLKDWKDESERPLLIQIPNNIYVCLTEAQVVDYVRTKFKLSAENTLQTSMYGIVEDIAPYHTPWRVIMCGEKAGDILENNDLILNLNPACRIEDASWIKPGKVMREVTLSTKGGKALVDFAVKRNLQYIHFDAGWYGFEYDKASDATTVTLDPKRNPDPNALNLQEVVKYAQSKGIGVFLYVNQRALQQQLDEILPLYKSWGIAGVKFGFVQVGSQVWTKWMHEAVTKCAKYGLMVDIHDEYRPTGFSRTYPNLMTQEGIYGNEEFPDATHNVTLPFTRFVAGAADYTICYYRQDFGRLNSENDAHGVPRSRHIKTTPSHQLALAVVYYSPLQYMYWYDKPGDSRDEPELKFFDDVYTTWDDTQVLQGEVAEYISIARRKGDEWFVGTITNNDARNLTVDMNFLSPDTEYIAEVYTDGDKNIETRTKVKVATYRVDSKCKMTFKLKASGGAAIRLIPNTENNRTIKKYKSKMIL